MSTTDITALLAKLKINGGEAAGDYTALVSHIQAEPRLIASTVAKLAEQVLHIPP